METPNQNQDVWGEMKLLAATAGGGNTSGGAWDALAAATRGGAAVLGIDADVGTLESGKWADLCCVDLSGPATQPSGDPVAQLVFCGGRDIVSDVWVAGRQLLSDGLMTRLDWPSVAARANAWGRRLNTGG
jgi:5-methylthioadenosine/S-adenosylhomocysteine deaminase